jgi:hypothetical protein
MNVRVHSYVIFGPIPACLIFEASLELAPSSTEAHTINKEQVMTEKDSREAVQADGTEAPSTTVQPDPEYPHIPYPIIRPSVGSPYYIDPRTGWASCLSRPGTRPLTLEDVRCELEDFP